MTDITENLDRIDAATAKLRRGASTGTPTQRQIVAEIVAFSMHGIGVGPAPDIATLMPLSLQDMLDAVRQIEADNKADREIGGRRSFEIEPDDRLTAAVYTFLHYCTPGNHDAGDDDDAIVHLKIDGTLHGLVKWARREADACK